MSAKQIRSFAENAKAWPFAEARALQDRIAKLKERFEERLEEQIAAHVIDDEPPAEEKEGKK